MKVEHTISGAVLDVEQSLAEGLVRGGQYTAVEEDKPKRATTRRKKTTEAVEASE